MTGSSSLGSLVADFVLANGFPNHAILSGDISFTQRYLVKAHQFSARNHHLTSLVLQLGWA